MLQTERAMWNTQVVSYKFDLNQNKQTQKDWLDEWDKASASLDKIIPLARELNHGGTINNANAMKDLGSEYIKDTREYSELALVFPLPPCENWGI